MFKSEFENQQKNVFFPFLGKNFSSSASSACKIKNMTIQSEGITPDNPSRLIFLGKQGGLSGGNFFIRDFLTKKFSGASRWKKEGGVI